jgi:superoxide dismutase
MAIFPCLNSPVKLTENLTFAHQRHHQRYRRQLRKVDKTKTAYLSDEALCKIIYSAMVDPAKK